jgi:uncharacterized protein YlxW (UPF0749 family)
MKKPLISCCVAVAAMQLTCMSLNAVESKTPATSESNAQMVQRVHAEVELLDRVAALEAKVAELEKKVNNQQRITLSTSGQLVPLSTVPLQGPAGSEAHEFNGSTFYVIPLAGSNGAPR